MSKKNSKKATATETTTVPAVPVVQVPAVSRTAVATPMEGSEMPSSPRALILHVEMLTEAERDAIRAVVEQAEAKACIDYENYRTSTGAVKAATVALRMRRDEVHKQLIRVQSWPVTEAPVEDDVSGEGDDKG